MILKYKYYIKTLFNPIIALIYKKCEKYQKNMKQKTLSKIIIFSKFEK